MNLAARMMKAQEHSRQDRNGVFLIIDTDESSSAAEDRNMLINIVRESLVSDAW